MRPLPPMRRDRTAATGAARGLRLRGNGPGSLGCPLQRNERPELAVQRQLAERRAPQRVGRRLHQRRRGALHKLNLRINNLKRGDTAGTGQPLKPGTHLDLSYNYLSGEIPAELGSLSNLQLLDLSDNDLSGEIPAELGSLSNLTLVALILNNLSGEIPPELGSLSNLTELYLGDNALSGEIPAKLGSLSNLTVLGDRPQRLERVRARQPGRPVGPLV